MSSNSKTTNGITADRSSKEKNQLTGNVFTVKNKILTDLTRAIQLVQKSFLETDKGPINQPINNSNYYVHELTQQFDNMLLFGLKKAEEGYWKLVIEFTHRNIQTDLKRLLNINTVFGLGRAWIYQALNDNLMESYLKCFLDNKKLVLKHYKKEQALLLDEQVVSVLVTLVSGLENVEFKLYSDVPYLDHTCWPTHFNEKRQVVDKIVNASPGTLSQLANFNSTQKENTQNSNAAISKTSKITINKIRRAKSLKPSVLGSSANSRVHVNNISFDASPESSSNNLGFDGDSMSTCGSESGRFTATNNTVSPTTSDNVGVTLRNSNEFLNEKGLKVEEAPNSEEKNENNNNDSHFKPIVKKLDNLEDSLLSLNRMGSTNSIDYENEIDKLRKENNLKIENRRLEKKEKNAQQNPNETNLSEMKHSTKDSSLNRKKSSSTTMNLQPDQDLAASSLTISKSFDIKIKHLESSLQAIENATLNMDAFVNDMTSVYQDYDEKLCNESQGEDEYLNNENKSINLPENINKFPTSTSQPIQSVYDMVMPNSSPESDNLNEKINTTDNNITDNTISTKTNSKNNVNTSGFDDTLSMQSMADANILAEETRSFKSVRSNTSISNLNDSGYLAKFEPTRINELKQEIKVDNNTKLMIMIEIFEHGEDEQLIKFYHATRGHSQGEVEHINMLISSNGIYILIKNEIKSDADLQRKQSISSSNPSENKTYRTDAFISFKQIDYVEVSLEAQAIHLVCINKRQSCWFTFACRNLTEHLIESLQEARSFNKLAKPSVLSVFREATQQKLSIKKFLANEENISNADVELKGYSLVYFEDQASAVSQMINKEGILWFLNKSSSASGSSWKKAYFVLKNDTLTKYRNSNDKRPLQVIKLNGEDFEGCRRNTTLQRANTIELILSNSNAVYLSAQSKSEASDWLQCFCKVISLGNLHSDDNSNSCLPCCSIITPNRCYFCHEDLNTGFYRLLEVVRMQEISRISFDNENPYFCILHDDADAKSNKYWIIYFNDEQERNIYITRVKEIWDEVFQVPLLIEACKSSEIRKRCKRTVAILHKEWLNKDE